MTLGIPLLVSSLAVTAIDWSAPETCPARNELEAAFHRLAGPNAESPTAFVQLAQRQGHFVLRVNTASGGERTLESADCRQLIEAAALILSLEARPGAPIRLAEAPSPPPPPPPRWWLTASGGALGGPLGTLAARGGLGLTVDLRILELELFASTGAEQSHLGLFGASSGTVVGLPFVGELRACFRLLETRLIIAGCLGGAAGVYSARGVGLSRVQAGTAPWLAGEAGLEVSASLSSWFRVRAQGQLIASAIRPRINVGEQTVFQPELLGGQVSLGIAVSPW